MAGLRFDSMLKIYPSEKGEILAVDNLNLDINDGEIIGLLGSSGCGKTTTLRAVAGFVKPTKGTISMDGQEIQDLPPAQRKVAMAFEGYALYPPLKIRDNIGFALLRGNASRAETEQAVNEISATLEIDDILDAYPAAISAGQQQRTSLARALVRKAPVTLLDEPMSQLEPRLRTLLRARVKDFLVQHRRTTIFVTHDQNEAITLADRIAVMEQGQLQQFDTATNLRDKPSNLFVAEFIGEPPMNIIAARVTEQAGQLAFTLLQHDTALGTIAAPTDRQLNFSANQQIKVGIRPHRIEIDPAATLRAKIISNQWLGDQAHLLVDWQGLRLVVVSTERYADCQVDTEVGLRLPAAALLFFDPTSGLALT